MELEKLKAMYTELYKENKKVLQEKKINVMTKEIKKETTSEEYTNSNRIAFIISKISEYVFKIIFLCALGIFMTQSVTESEMKNASSILYLLIGILGFCMIFSSIYSIKLGVSESKKQEVSNGDYIKEKKEYNDLIIENICVPIITTFFPYILYEHNNGISEKIYNNMGFPVLHELYKSTDHIGLNSNVEIAKVYTQITDVHNICLFNGIVSVQKFSFFVPVVIKIRNKNSESLKFKNPVLLNNPQFNNFYELETDNEDLLNKFLDDTIVNYLVNLAQKEIKCEINIIQNNMYIRIEDEEFLEFDIEDEENNLNIIVNSCEKIVLMSEINEFMQKELNK